MKHEAVAQGYVPVKESLPVALTRARDALLSHWRPVLAEQGFTEQQWRVLRTVNEYEPIDISTLSSFAALHMPSVTRILRTLEAAGYVERERDAGDSRRIWVRVTPKAREAMYQNGAAAREINDIVRERLGAQNLQELSRLLALLAEIKLDD